MTKALDFDKLAETWNSFYPHKFRIDGQTLKSHTVESLVFNPELSLFNETPSGHLVSTDGACSEFPGGWIIAIKDSATPSLYKGQDPDRAHIAAWASSKSTQTFPEPFLTAVYGAKSSGRKRIAFGMDPDHLLPGVPEEMTELIDQLASTDFNETGRCFDLERDLQDYVLPESCTRAIHDQKAEVRPCTKSDITNLGNYFKEEFPGRWRHDVMRKVVNDDEPDQVYLLLVDGKIEGHAMTQQDGCKRPVAGAVWKLDLGADWGALGSIGVSKSERGKGLGNALLGCSLDFLKQKGARQTIIDWTTLGDFYGAHGFEVTRRYINMVKEL